MKISVHSQDFQLIDTYTCEVPNAFTEFVPLFLAFCFLSLSFRLIITNRKLGDKFQCFGCSLDNKHGLKMVAKSCPSLPTTLLCYVPPLDKKFSSFPGGFCFVSFLTHFPTHPLTHPRNCSWRNHFNNH